MMSAADTPTGAAHERFLEGALMAELGGSSARSAAFAAVGLPPASTLARQILMLARLDSALLGLKKQLAVLSMTEGFVAVVALLFWMANTTQQRGIWLHFPHFARWATRHSHVNAVCARCAAFRVALSAPKLN